MCSSYNLFIKKCWITSLSVKPINIRNLNNIWQSASNYVRKLKANLCLNLSEVFDISYYYTELHNYIYPFTISYSKKIISYQPNVPLILNQTTHKHHLFKIFSSLPHLQNNQIQFWNYQKNPQILLLLWHNTVSSQKNVTI